MEHFYPLIFFVTSLGGIFISILTYFKYDSRGKNEISFAFFFTGLLGLISFFRFYITGEVKANILFSLSLTSIFMGGYNWYCFGAIYTGRSLLDTDLVSFISDEISFPDNTQLSYLFLSGILFLSLTNIFHSLLWSGFTYIPTVEKTEMDKTVLYYALTIVGYGWYLTGVYYISVFAKKSKNYGLMIIVSASILPMISTQILPYAFSFPIQGPLILMSLGGFLSILIAFLGIQRLFTLKPIAREKVFRDADSAIAIFESDFTLKDSNQKYLELNAELGGSLQEKIVNKIDFKSDSTTETTQFGNSIYTITITPISVFGQSAGYAVILEDITELETQKQQLERTNYHFRRFSDSTAHELRNPLTVVTGYAEYIKANETDEELQKMADKILQQAHQIESLTNDFKTAMEAAQTLDEKEYTELETVFEQNIDLQKYENIDPIRITNDAKIEVGKFRFPQIFENLFKFVQINTKDETNSEIVCVAKDEKLCFTVTGVAIDKSSIEGLLEHGYTTHHNGTGLALSIIDTIAEVHGWTVDIEPMSKNDEGFKLTFNDVQMKELKEKHITM